MNTFVIANPKSRLGQTGERLPELRILLLRHLGEHTLLETTREGDGERLAREAQARGATRIVVAGGDGTVSEVVTGLLRDTNTTDVALGLLPLGTGRDFARLLSLGGDLEQAIRRLSQGKQRRVDAGRINAKNPDGSDRTRCFLNIASFGLSGESTLWLREQAETGKRTRLSYLLSSLVGLQRYTMPPIRVELDGQLVHDGPLTLAVAANGQYFAGGMQVAPQAQIDDGLLDVVLVPKLPVLSALSRLPKLFRGKHVDGRSIRMQRARRVTAQSPQTVWLEADGELIGQLPVSVEVLPAALTLFGLP